MDPVHVNYAKFYDQLCSTLNLSRFKKIPEDQRSILMTAFVKVLCRHSDYLPLMNHSAELGIIERSYPHTGQTFNKFSRPIREFKREPTIRINKIPEPIKIELSCLPTPDFVFSQNPVNMPDFYKSKIEVPTETQTATAMSTQQFPVNVLLGNVNIFKYFNAIRYLGQPTSMNTPGPQVPVQSYITYLWGAAIDQYYQVALQNNLL
ncbi:hypothetical protein O3M35_005231 [Rhynocoris fuscipes]|uniref:Uncharacterized protein n=1 Tax=Rhynocoris fuscipes TaxID=488301 RepID=A0AAW1DJR5_9HEMI